ncbi:MAG: HAMP domain-containing sensor histidine kinase [Bacteroidia bacterium]|nr:HAMP domain-containing sensor histidine kinase [Bacteroidia bacterium]
MFNLESQPLSRWLIFGVAFAIVMGSIGYSNYLAKELSVKERARIEMFKDGFGILEAENPEEGYSFAVSYFIQHIMQDTISRIPIVLLNEDKESVGSYVGLGPDVDSAEVEGILSELKKGFEPIEVEFDKDRYQYIYYGESDLLKQLKWYPYIQILIVILFIGFVFYGFITAQRNEQNRVWVGLAKETAHQLGTPVSSLMAWIELLKIKLEESPEDHELLEEMEHDVLRLENIAERFSKIGSKPELIEVKLKEVLDRSSGYLKKRMTQRGKIKLYVNNDIPLDSTLHVNPQLFDWVIENLLKNALDAMQAKGGEITLNAGEQGKYFYIDVIDTGKGIPKGNFKKVFEPGFTTKKRGWGLGLSLTKRIVENYHKGKIFVKTSELEKGTTFRVLLPK